MAVKKNRLSTTPNRNALCPCGSRRAFKNCCAKKRAATPDKPDSMSNQLKRILVGLVVCGVMAGVVALAVTRPWVPEPEREPFEYDPDNNRYWHAGDGQWHDGRPPYHPYEYDPERHQYFHPGDDDWRDGRPPRQ